MPKQVARHAIEHWRDGELIEKVKLSPSMFKWREDGTTFIVIPPTFIELATGDELHFDRDGLIELLQNI